MHRGVRRRLTPGTQRHQSPAHRRPARPVRRARGRAAGPLGRAVRLGGSPGGHRRIPRTSPRRAGERRARFAHRPSGGAVRSGRPEIERRNGNDRRAEGSHDQDEDHNSRGGGAGCMRAGSERLLVEQYDGVAEIHRSHRHHFDDGAASRRPGRAGHQAEWRQGNPAGVTQARTRPGEGRLRGGRVRRGGDGHGLCPDRRAEEVPRERQDRSEADHQGELQDPDRGAPPERPEAVQRDGGGGVEQRVGRPRRRPRLDLHGR